MELGDDFFGTEKGDNLDSFTQLLRQAWVNERAAPELMTFEDDLVNMMKSEIEDQEIAIENDRREKEKSVTNDLAEQIYRMELHRIKFVLKSYLRTRLKKIEKYCIHILSTRDEENNLLADRLSAEELQYAQKYLDLVQKHFETSLLDHIPETLRAMDAKNDNENMVNEPDLDSFVFMRVKEDIGQFKYNDDIEIPLASNDILAARYRPFKELLKDDGVELM